MVPTTGDTSVRLRADVSRLPRIRGTQSTELRLLQIARALPPGRRVAPSQGAWLATVAAAPAVELLRADAAARLLELARAIAHAADWSTRTTRPTWQRLCDYTGMGRRTVARWLAWLRAEGLLGIVESGSTPELRPMALAHLEGNRAAVYVLAVPSTGEPVDETGTPSSPTFGGDPTHTRESDLEESPLRGPDRRTTTNSSSWRWTASPRTGTDRLGLAQRLQERIPALRSLTDRHLRHLLRPWLSAGWSAADVLHALDHEPDGSARTWTTSVRSPKGWLSHRLAAWRGLDGTPLTPPSAVVAERVTRTRQEQAERAAAVAERESERQAEHDLAHTLRTAAGEVWEHLLATVARQHGQRRVGAMVEALARSAVRRQLEDQEEPSAEQLRIAAAAALAEALGAA